MPENKKSRKEDVEDVVIGVYVRRYSPEKLPEKLYLSTGKKLMTGVKKGFGKTEFNFVMDAKDAELIEELRTNIYMFSAAKTFQQTLEMTDSLVDDDGNRRIYADFKEEATKIYERYNGTDVEDNELSGWLKTEYDTAIGQARMAEKWNEIQKNKSDFPFLMYKTTEGEEVCDICSPLDGIILPVDDEFWDENYPENHFHCNCTVIQMDADMANENGGIDSSEDAQGWATKSQENKNPLFNMNAGKDKVIFKDTGRNKHPYFEVPARYRELARNNFNLQIPKDEN